MRYIVWVEDGVWKPFWFATAEDTVKFLLSDEKPMGRTIVSYVAQLVLNTESLGVN